MQKLLLLLPITVFLTSCSHSYYVVRHAEKAVPSAGTTMSTPDDPLLSDAGVKRAEALKQVLIGKNIRHIFSTDTKRTKQTAEPLSKQSGVTIQIYGPRPDSVFTNQLKRIKENTLIVGHSNTVDDLVNSLINDKKLSDLADSEYDNLFIVRYKSFFGKKISYNRVKY
ncbi:MAG: SixA phosphatase family protein [Flavisolibacter sp.]